MSECVCGKNPPDDPSDECERCEIITEGNRWRRTALSLAQKLAGMGRGLYVGCVFEHHELLDPELLEHHAIKPDDGERWRDAADLLLRSLLPEESKQCLCVDCVQRLLAERSVK